MFEQSDRDRGQVNNMELIKENMFEDKDSLEGKEEILKKTLGLGDDANLEGLDDETINQAMDSVSKTEKGQEAKETAIEDTLGLEEGSLEDVDEEVKDALIDAAGKMGESLSDVFANVEKIVECLETVDGTPKDIVKAIHINTGMKYSESLEVYTEILKSRKSKSKINAIYEALEGNKIADAFKCCSEDDSTPSINGGNGTASETDVEHPCKSLENQTGEKI